MKRLLPILCCILPMLSAWADEVPVIEANMRYRIESLYFAGSSACLGVNHQVNSPVAVEQTPSRAKYSDCYWYFEAKGNNTYAIRNAYSNQYLVFDEEYTNSPTILRYMNLSNSADSQQALWYIKVPPSSDNVKTFYFQSAYNTNYFFNVRTGTFVLGCYEMDESATYTSMNSRFYIYDSNEKPLATKGGTIDPEPEPDPDPILPIDTVVIDSTKALAPITGPILHIYRADGKIDAIPEQYITNRTQTEELIEITTVNGAVYSYIPYEVDSISNTVPSNFPTFQTFKFNNKYNAHIIEDAHGLFYGDTLITATVVGIGKTLRPSFSIDHDAQAWIDDQPQQSRYSRVRFTHDVTYTIARQGSTILRQTLAGDYKTCPYGNQTKVRVDFASDHSTATYGVPTIYINTNNGTMVTSKDYYWDATIRIDGGGVFPDMDETPMQIKGRGNTSWTPSGKAPYRIKFAEALKPFGLKKGKNWNLIANAQTLSMTTNAIAQKMAQLVETAGINHEIPCDLYMNGQYRGSYNFTEKIGLANNSIDLENESYATLLELDLYWDEIYKFRTTDYGLPVNIKQPDFSEGTTLLTQSQIENSFNRVTEALKNGENLEFFVDLDYLARFLFVDEFAANAELMHPKSTFCYNPNVMDSGGRYIFGPVWDFDWAFGYAGTGRYFQNNATLDFWERKDGAGYAWAYKQRYCGENFNKIYYNLWYDFVNNGKLDELIDFCDDYYRFAYRSFSHDNTKWRQGDAQAYATVTANSKQWLRTRAEYVLDYMTNTLGYGSLNYITNQLKPVMGDVNNDGRITTADVVCVLNFIMNLPNEEFYFVQADIDKNKIVSVADLISIRNKIGSARSSGFYGLPRAEAIVTTGPVAKTLTGISVPLIVSIDEGDYSGIQFDLKIPAGMMIEDLDVSRSIPDFDVYVTPIEADDAPNASTDTYRVSIYSSAKNKLPLGDSNLELQLGWGANTPSSQLLTATLAEVMFVSAMGEDERTESCSATFTADDLTGLNTAISLAQHSDNRLTVHTNEPSVLPVYSVDGRIVRMYQLEAGSHEIKLPAGIYIINKQKIIVRQ